MTGLLSGKNIIVAITGGIAAYKVAELVRLLSKAGAGIQVIMTPAGKAFMQPLTFQALSGRAVRDSLLDPSAEMGMGHIELARWADLVIIAPATADAIARLSMGMANDLLTTVVLATHAPVALVPAMNQIMWENPLTQRNIKSFFEERDGTMIWGPAIGDQACGDNGPGRMIEAQEIFSCTLEFFASGKKMNGLKVVLTAGPTRERIDPVRYISNDSSGKMGFALAECAQRQGAEVVVISGPVTLDSQTLEQRGIKFHRVESAKAMLDATLAEVTNHADIFIAAAAVADYRVTQVAQEKIKKSAEELTLKLVRNPDVLATVAALDNSPFCVGFAAETQQLVEFAREKMSRKNLQMIIANDVSQAGIGFNSDHNAVTIISGPTAETIEKMPKTQLAETLLDRIMTVYQRHPPKG